MCSILTASVPGAEQVDAAGEETGLKQAKDSSQAGQLVVVFDKTHAHRDDTPEEGDSSKMDARSDGTNEDSGRGLKDDVGDEEDEIGNVLQRHLSVAKIF